MPGHHIDSVSRPLQWLERLLLIAGAGALIWCAVIVGEGLLAQRHAARSLEMAMAVEQLQHSMPAPQAESPLVSPAEVSRHTPMTIGAAIAALSIPRVQLSAVVLHGSDAHTLRRGPGHLERSALPGDAGNIVIAGHRDSFFRPLRHIRFADDIFLETGTGRFHYRVTSLRVVGPREVSVIAPTSEETLTLITCYPFWVLGEAPDRFIVRATRVHEQGTATIVAWTLTSPEWLGTPVLPQVVPQGRTSIARPTDDDTLVRQAVRRYLAVAGSTAGTCLVSITGDRARVDCGSSGDGMGRESARGFDLVRSNAGWVIKSIEVNTSD
jgi:sortase A